MEKVLLSVAELTEKMSGFSHTYHLVDVHHDRDSYYAIDEESYMKPETYMCLNGYLLNLIMDGELEKARKFLNSLPDADMYKFLKIGMEIVFPAVTWAQFINDIKFLKQINFVMPNVVLTAGRPSILNGFNDFSRLGPVLTKNKDVFIDHLKYLYEYPSCNSIYNVCLAEYYYQRDKVLDAEVLISRTIKEFNNDSERRLLFASLYIQVKVLLAQGKNVDSESYITSVRNYVKENGKAEFSYNINAAEVMLSLYEGKREVIANWMNTDAPDEFGDFCMLDLYRYMVKIRCYIINQKYTAVVALAEKLRPLLEEGRRRMDLCELDLLLAINFYRAKEKELSFEALERALKLIRRHKYYRLLADEGEAIFYLLIDYMKEKGESDFLMMLIEKTRRMAINYPLYLKPQYKNETFSQMEIDILKLLEQGKQKEDIAECFFISVNTVKYHLKNIYSKLDAGTATQAVWEARVMGII